jgi:glutathione S-transferase
MSQLILHHYPQSPASEKVRVALGIKGLAWRSVEIPRLPPRPDLFPLTGGYRRTPVMQIGADIYCDSQCILRELERRFPQPSLFPGGADGLAWAVSRWTDSALFTLVAAVLFGEQGQEMPAEFLVDRGRLYFGPDFDPAALRRDLGHNRAQLRAQLGWMEQRLAGGRPFMLGDRPGLPDALCYHVVWFVRDRYRGGPGLLSEMPMLLAWEERVRKIGHGNPTAMTSTAALELAGPASPAAAAPGIDDDVQNLRAGMSVSVTPDDDGGDPEVYGLISYLDHDSVTLLRRDPAAGEIAVHFPRVGYRVRPRRGGVRAAATR